MTACDELHEMLKLMKSVEVIYDTPQVLIYCNKQDLQNAMSVELISQRLEFGEIDYLQQRCVIMGCSAMRNEGLTEPLGHLFGT